MWTGVRLVLNGRFLFREQLSAGRSPNPLYYRENIIIERSCPATWMIPFGSQE